MKAALYSIVSLMVVISPRIDCREMEYQLQPEQPEDIQLRPPWYFALQPDSAQMPAARIINNDFRTPWFSLRPPIAVDAGSLVIVFPRPSLSESRDFLFYDCPTRASSAYDFTLAGNPANKLKLHDKAR